MNKVTELYPPEIAKHKLSDHFSENVLMLEMINHMGKSDLCVFAALCDGKTITTTGYEIDADLSVKRASAVIHSLKQKNLPISTNTIPTQSDVGGTTKQSVFFISDDDLRCMKSNPEKVMKKCEKLQVQQKRSHAQKDVARLCREFGKDGVLKLLNQVAANDQMPPDAMSAG
jgi:hypothetical protein